jgi:hypothetical protein
MSDEQDKLRKLLNASGFAFQLALESAVRSTPADEPWKVTGREHPWSTASGSGYIDLVLSRGNIHLVIECKRSRDAVWMFLMPDDKQLSRSHARVRWTDTRPQRPDLADWGDVQVYPSSPEADFCVVRGQGERDAPLLERIAASVAESADGLSGDLLELRKGERRTSVIIPVIVTTAELLLSQFDPKEIDLKTGEVSAATFTAVPHLRFRKSLAPSAVPDHYEPTSFRDLRAASERTVFVVNGQHFTSWLNAFAIGGSSWPWESARSAADAMGG